MYNDIADVYDEIFPLNRAFLNFIPAYLPAQEGRVLDLGCGPGDYADSLAKDGYEATGIDLSAGMIEMAKSRNRGEFHQLSLTEIDRLSGTFDCVYCIGNSLSYLPANSMAKFTADVARLLNAGGYFVMQVVNWDRIRLTKETNFDVKLLSNGQTFHRRYEWASDEAVIFHTEIRDGDAVRGVWADTLYPKYLADLISAFEAAGLPVTGKFGDFAGAPYDPESSPATVLVFRKS